MARSRADEILEGWKMVAHNASKPAVAPRPHTYRTALPLGIVGAAAFVILLVIGLAGRGNGLGPQASPLAGGPSAATPSPTATSTTRPSASPSPKASPSPTATSSPTEAPTPTAPAQAPSAAEVAAAGQAVDRYTADLVRGDDAHAWAMLAPETQQGYGSYAAFKSERTAFFHSVAGRYSVTTSPTDIGPITQWVSGTGGASIDLRHAVLVEVTYPAIAQSNQWSAYIVSPGPDGLLIYEVR